MNVFSKVATRFIVAGASGVLVGVLCFQLFYGMGISGSYSNLLGYGCGGLVNLSIQWRMRNYHAR